MATNKTKTEQTESKEENIIQMEKPQTVQDVLKGDIYLLKGLNFTMDEVERFVLIIAKVEQDLEDCVTAIEREEKKHGNTDAE